MLSDGCGAVVGPRDVERAKRAPRVPAALRKPFGQRDEVASRARGAASEAIRRRSSAHDRYSQEQ